MRDAMLLRIESKVGNREEWWEEISLIFAQSAKADEGSVPRKRKLGSATRSCICFHFNCKHDSPNIQKNTPARPLLS